MGTGASKASGGGGGGGSKIQPTSLDMVREDREQLNNALRKGREQNAYEIQYTNIAGQTIRRYFNGATYSDRKSALYESTSGKYKTKGTYKARFKKPKNWK